MGRSAQTTQKIVAFPYNGLFPPEKSGGFFFVTHIPV